MSPFFPTPVEIDWAKEDPLTLIERLEKHPSQTLPFEHPPHDWIQEQHLPQLMGLIDSNEPTRLKRWWKLVGQKNPRILFNFRYHFWGDKPGSSSYEFIVSKLKGWRKSYEGLGNGMFSSFGPLNIHVRASFEDPEWKRLEPFIHWLRKLHEGIGKTKHM